MRDPDVSLKGLGLNNSIIFQVDLFMKNFLSLLYCFLVLLLVVPLPAQDRDRLLSDFDAYVEQSRQRFEVPGCAVAIVHQGEVIFSKGYGHLSVKEETPVNTETLFGIMSTTKAMTAAAMGVLVDEGKVSWDDRVVDYLPDFQLYDPYVTRSLRVRDLFTHNAGLGNTDFLWAWDSKADQDYILQQMRLAVPAYPFRGGYTYQNIMYLVAGKVIEAVSGMTWERFMKERIYAPLDMNNTFPNLAYSQQYQNRSRAHQRLNDDIITIPEMSADPIAPAGATWSTIADMAKWVQFMLEDEGDLLSTETKAEILKPQVIIPREQFYPTTQLTQPNWTTYGLGWFQQDYRGSMLNFHTGSLDGRTAIVGLMKEHDFGFYFFGNLDHAELRHALMLRAIDAFVFEDTQRDWSEEVYTLYAKMREAGEAALEKRNELRVEGTSTSHALSAYVGEYTHPFYGTAKIFLQDDGLHFKMGPEQTGSLVHWHYDTFMVHFEKAWWTPSLITFRTDSQTGSINELAVGAMVLKRQK
jgi:CubicO group peptidase (beta-lactamase class C family)